MNALAAEDDWQTHCPMKDGDWFACDFPERMPVLDVTWFHFECRPCLLAATAMDPYWIRTPWPPLSQCMSTPHPGRTKLYADADGVLHNIGVADPPIVVTCRAK